MQTLEEKGLLAQQRVESEYVARVDGHLDAVDVEHAGAGLHAQLGVEVRSLALERLAQVVAHLELAESARSRRIVLRQVLEHGERVARRRLDDALRRLQAQVLDLPRVQRRQLEAALEQVLAIVVELADEVRMRLLETVEHEALDGLLGALGALLLLACGGGVAVAVGVHLGVVARLVLGALDVELDAEAGEDGLDAAALRVIVSQHVVDVEVSRLGRGERHYALVEGGEVARAYLGVQDDDKRGQRSVLLLLEIEPFVELIQIRRLPVQLVDINHFSKWRKEAMLKG